MFSPLNRSIFLTNKARNIWLVSFWSSKWKQWAGDFKSRANSIASENILCVLVIILQTTYDLIWELFGSWIWLVDYYSKMFLLVLLIFIIWPHIVLMLLFAEKCKVTIQWKPNYSHQRRENSQKEMGRDYFILI